MYNSKQLGTIVIQDGAAGVRNINQYCVKKVINGTAHYYNEKAKGYWSGFGTVLTKSQAKKVLKFMRKYDRAVNAPVKSKVTIKVSYDSDSNLWFVDAATRLTGTCVAFTRKPSAKQLRQLRKAVAIAKFNTHSTYSIAKGKFIR